MRPPKGDRPTAESERMCCAVVAKVGGRAQAAEAVAVAALDLAQRARAAGLAAIAHLLETAALEASAEATAQRWPTEG